VVAKKDWLPGDDQGNRGPAGAGGMRTAPQRNISLVERVSQPLAARPRRPFGNSGVYIEKFIENPHHVEFQILGDNRGHNHSPWGERDLLDPAAQSEGRRGIAFAAHRETSSRSWREKMGKSGNPNCRGGPITPMRAPWSSSWITTGNFYFLEMNKTYPGGTSSNRGDNRHRPGALSDYVSDG